MKLVLTFIFHILLVDNKTLCCYNLTEMENQILTELTDKTQGLFYFSESEAPLTIENLGQVPKDQLNEKLLQLNRENPGTLTTIDQDAFFEKIVNTADPGDQVMVGNAQKFTELYTYLKDNFSDILVTRIEGGVNVPILITAYLADGTCIALATYAIET
jgi:hypothetical protein